MAVAELIVDLKKITENSRTTVEICRPFGIEILGVTKSAAGHPSVARAMLDGGIKTLADSRLDNIAKMRDAGIQVSNYFAPVHLQPFMVEKFGYKKGDFPITESIADRTIALPFYNNLTKDDIATVAQTLKQILDKI